MRPLSGALWSISKPDGRVGEAAQAHVGAGQVGIVGNGGGLLLLVASARRGTIDAVCVHILRASSRCNVMVGAEGEAGVVVESSC